MGVLLALAAAFGYGVSDFVGGVTARRTSAWPVALMAAVGALVGSTVQAILWPGDPTTADLLWGLLGGVGSGVGSGFLYRGLASGRMGVVGPVSAVGSASLPVVVGLALGERPDLLAWLGLAVAVPGIWLVSREPGGAGASAAGLADGVLAGLGFGLIFVATGQIGPHAGIWPLVGTQAVSLVVLPAIALALHADPLPRSRHDLWGVVAGLLASGAMLGFLLASHRTLLSVASVITALYPAVTILLAVAIGERIHRTQALGLLLCGGTVVCMSLG